MGRVRRKPSSARPPPGRDSDSPITRLCGSPILLTVQQLLGHTHIASTMAYVRPCPTFVEDAWHRATATALTGLAGCPPEPS